MHTGTLTVTVTGPRGDLQDIDLLPFNTDADNNSNMFVLKFLPCMKGTAQPLPLLCALAGDAEMLSVNGVCT